MQPFYDKRKDVFLNLLFYVVNAEYKHLRDENKDRLPFLLQYEWIN